MVAPARTMLLLLATGLAVAWPTGAAARQPRVLVVTEAHHFVHPSIPAARRALAALGRRSSAFDVTLLPSAAALTAARLHGAGAVVFASTDGELRVDAAWKARLLAFVRGGGGFVGVHSASNTLDSWPGWEALLGARFVSHPRFGPGRVVVADGSNPATAHLPARFTTRDEFYVFDHAPAAHVLLTTGAGAPLAWCRGEGAGRVFYDALGHAAAAWSDPRFLAQVSGGIRWALGAGAAC